MEESQSSPYSTGAMVGGIAAVVALLLGGISMIPLCGCVAGPLSWALPTVAGVVGGAMAASRADWSSVPAGEELLTGAGIGVRAGGVAALIAVIAFVVISVILQILGLVLSALLNGDMDNVIEMLTIQAAVIGIAFAVQLGIGFASLIGGVLFGAGAGAIVGSTKS